MATAFRPGVPGVSDKNTSILSGPRIDCTEDMHLSAIILTVLGGAGVVMNFLFVMIILVKRPLERSIFNCQAISKCSLVETTFLLLVTVSTVNLLTVILNDAPVVPEEEEAPLTNSIIRDNPQCVAFGLFMIWFSSITVNLGPTFLSGALAANSEENIKEPSCPLVQGPNRHYILNVLWILINLLCMVLTIYHLHKLYRDFTKSNVETVRIASLLTSMINIQTDTGLPPMRMKTYLERMEKEGVARVKIFTIITCAYLIFWGPLFLVTLLHPGWEWKDAKKSMLHEVTLHVAFVHSFVNPLLFLVLHQSARSAALDIFCCMCTRSKGIPDPPPRIYSADTDVEIADSTSSCSQQAHSSKPSFMPISHNYCSPKHETEL